MSKVELDVLLTDHGAVQTGMDVRQAAARKNDRQTGRIDTTSQILCELSIRPGRAVLRRPVEQLYGRPMRSEYSGEYGNIGDLTGRSPDGRSNS